MRIKYWLSLLTALVIAGSVSVRAQEEATQIKVFVKVWQKSATDKEYRNISNPRITTRMGIDALVSIGEGDRQMLSAKITPRPKDDEHFRLDIEIELQNGGSGRSLKTVLITQDGEPHLVGGLNSRDEGKEESLLFMIGATRLSPIGTR